MLRTLEPLDEDMQPFLRRTFELLTLKTLEPLDEVIGAIFQKTLEPFLRRALKPLYRVTLLTRNRTTLGP